MTNELCLNTCQSKEYGVADIEFGDGCCCGNALTGTATLALMTDCEALLCPGNAMEFFLAR
jgi:WSC domain